MTNRSHTLKLAPLVCALLVGCGPDTGPAPRPVEMPSFDDPGLNTGRLVWAGACRSCHLLGVAGAPSVTAADEWDRRLAKGREPLYQSTLTGIRDERGVYRMPPRGGNPRLSETEVRLAVDYMLAAVGYLRASTR